MLIRFTELFNVNRSAQYTLWRLVNTDTTKKKKKNNKTDSSSSFANVSYS